MLNDVVTIEKKHTNAATTLATEFYTTANQNLL
jgi:hypothetical protein